MVAAVSSAAQQAARNKNKQATMKVRQASRTARNHPRRFHNDFSSKYRTRVVHTGGTPGVKVTAMRGDNPITSSSFNSLRACWAQLRLLLREVPLLALVWLAPELYWLELPVPLPPLPTMIVASPSLVETNSGSCPICAQAEAARTCLEPLTKLVTDVSGWGSARPPEASATTL